MEMEVTMLSHNTVYDGKGRLRSGDTVYDGGFSHSTLHDGSGR